MLKMVRQQMICIIAPGWRSAVDFSESGSMHSVLEALFKNVEVVQFASIALLPARADSQDQLPSLMLELAIEEGINPRDMLYRLVNHPSGATWSLYSSYWRGVGAALESERNRRLLDRLMEWLRSPMAASSAPATERPGRSRRSRSCLNGRETRRVP
jgi:hypothetical protein